MNQDKTNSVHLLGQCSSAWKGQAWKRMRPPLLAGVLTFPSWPGEWEVLLSPDTLTFQVSFVLP